MRRVSIPHLLLALSSQLLLLSCSTTPRQTLLLQATGKHSGPTGAQDLAHFVLVIQEEPEGRITHYWQSARGFDLSEFLSATMHEPERESAQRNATRRIVRTAWNRDCEEERDTCEDNCMSSDLGPNWSHIRTQGAKYRECRGRCWKPYIDCCRLRELEGQRFQAIDTAVDWLKRHRTEILVGTSVVISGVAFVVVVAGSGGLLVLAPAVFLMSLENPAASDIATVKPW